MPTVEVTETWWWWTHAAATWAMVGLIWIVQRVVYPLMAQQSGDNWVAWHAAYTQRMGSVVGPLMLIELAGAMWWCWREPSALLAWLAAGLVAVNWLSTAVLQIPLHRRLGEGFDERAVRRLVTTNWVRTIAWSLRGGLILMVTLS